MKLFVELVLLSIVYWTTGIKNDYETTYLPFMFCASGLIIIILWEIMDELIKINKNLDKLRYK